MQIIFIFFLSSFFPSYTNDKRLVLAYSNDLSEQVRSRVRLFADDTALYVSVTCQKQTHYKKTSVNWSYGKRPGT